MDFGSSKTSFGVVDDDPRIMLSLTGFEDVGREVAGGTVAGGSFGTGEGTMGLAVIGAVGVIGEVGVSGTAGTTGAVVAIGVGVGEELGANVNSSSLLTFLLNPKIANPIPIPAPIPISRRRIPIKQQPIFRLFAVSLS